MNPEEKLTLWKKLIKALTEQFETTISSFITGCCFILSVMYFWVLPSKNQSIKEYRGLIEMYKQEREFWMNKYNSSPEEMDRIYKMLEGIRNGNSSLLKEKEKSLQIIEEQNEKLKELEQINNFRK